MSTSSITAAITTAASVASGRLSNRPVRNSSVTIVSTATTRPDTWLFAPAPPLTAVFDRLPLTTMPLARPDGEVGAAEPDQLAVGVDLVVVAGGVGLGRAEALGEADQRDADRAAGELQVVVEATRRARRAAAGRCRSCRRCRRRSGRAPRRHDARRRPPRASRARPARAAAAPGRARASPSPIASVAACVSPSLPSRSQSCSKKSPSPFSTPNSFGTWPMMIVSARPTMKPLSTGSEMKLARKPSRSSPATSATMPVDDRQRRGHRHVRGLALGGDGRHRGGRQRRGGRHRPDDQVARAAEQRVEQQRGRARRRGRRRARRRRSTRRRATRARAPPTPSGRRSRRRAATRGGSRGARRTSVPHRCVERRVHAHALGDARPLEDVQRGRAHLRQPQLDAVPAQLVGELADARRRPGCRGRSWSSRSARPCAAPAASTSASTRSLTALAFEYSSGPSLRTTSTPSGAAQSGCRSRRPQAPRRRVARERADRRAAEARDHVHQRQARGHHQPLQHAEARAPRAAPDRRRRPRCAARGRSAAARRRRRSPTTATMTIAAERRLRQVGEQRREERAGQQDQPRRGDAARAGCARRRRRRPRSGSRRPTGRSPTRTPPARCRAHRHEVAVGVGAVVVLGGEPAGHADRLGGERRARRAPARSSWTKSSAEMCGIAGSGSASGMWPTTSTPSSSRPSERRQGDGEHEHDERRRDLRRQPAERDQHARASRRRPRASRRGRRRARRSGRPGPGRSCPRRDRSRAGSAAGRPRSPSRARTGSRSSPASTRGRRSRRSAAARRATSTTADHERERRRQRREARRRRRPRAARPWRPRRPRSPSSR